MTELYNYQIEAVNQTDLHKKGILVYPTGTGKTMIQSAIIERDIQKHPNQFRIYVVNAPRIILTYQLHKDIDIYLTSRGIECIYHFVHSGSSLDIDELEKIRIQANVDGYKIPHSGINSTTNSKELTQVMKNARELNIPLVIFSTYHSAERIEESRTFIGSPINIILNDEAHNLVQEKFYDDLIGKINTEREYFFTATLRVNDSDDDTDLDNYESQEGRGMFNVESYGRVIGKLLPRDAIEMGMIVRPRIHEVLTIGVRSDEDFDRSLNKVIHNSFNSQIEHFKKFHLNIVPKIIVATRGSSDIKNFLNSDEYHSLRKMNVDIFAIMSDEEKIIGEDINGIKVNRQEFLKQIKEVGEDKTKMMLVLHYDILTEGVDVPGLTSCMPIRNLNKSRFIQTLGRCSRLDKDDRAKLISGEIDWTDVDKMNKPYSYIILPVLTETNKEDKKQMEKFVLQLRDYNFQPFEDIIRNPDAIGLPDEDEMDTASKPNRITPRSGTNIDYLRDVFEDERVANLSVENQFIENLN